TTQRHRKQAFFRVRPLPRSSQIALARAELNMILSSDCAITFAAQKFFRRSHNAVIRRYDEAGNVMRAPERLFLAALYREGISIFPPEFSGICPMELRHLRYFVGVAETENVSRAALKLHISQPAVSRQVRDLEDEIGLPLLRRAGKSVRLTEAG